MDPGIDDAMELLLALNNLELDLAVTTVSGNVNVSRATTNALKIIEASGSKVPVYRGAARPLRRRPVRAGHVHGSDGLGNSRLPRPSLEPEKTKAADMLAELLSTHKKNDVSIVATGPLTNIATLLKREPSLAGRLRLFVMGGIYDPLFRGNVTRHAEFNFYVDPEAADMVMRSVAEGATIVASGLDVTTDPRCVVDGDIFSKIGSMKSVPAQTARRILEYPIKRYGRFHLHDVFALFSMLHPEIFTMGRLGIRIDCSSKLRGRCIVSPAKNGGLLACRKVDHVRFMKYLLDGLR
jgi:inosine-uridine nucleoside N-ribohydrolase